MTILQAIILGIVQGLTEFLPISSSGHLALFQHWLGFASPPISFDITIHMATLVAVVIFFRKKIMVLGIGTLSAVGKRSLKHIPTEVWLVGVGTLPAIVVGLLLKSRLEALFNSLPFIGVGFLVSALVLFATRLCKVRTKDFAQMSWIDALVIGLFQAVAIFPGVSRSGSTVSTGLWRNLTHETAFEFSFLLAIPAIIGAQILDFGSLLTVGPQDIMSYFIGFVFASVSGFVALGLFHRVVKSDKLPWFGVYCAVLGVLTLLVF